MPRTSAASQVRTADMSTSPPPRRSALFERLRAETAAAHRDLESRMDLDGATLGVPRYTELLRHFRRANGAYESVVGDALPPALRPTFESRRKTALLDADLRHFGAHASELEDDLAAIARVVGGNPFAAIGAMYVFEGSTLGGAVVGRHLEQSLGLATLQGRSYFTPYPGRTGAMWRDFQAQVDDVVGDDPHAGDAVVGAAAATFAWLAQTLPGRR